MTGSALNALQYGTSEKLAARARLHRLYAHDEAPWFEWVARKAGLRPGMRVLDCGCGPGWFWAGAAGVLPAGLDLTLTDLSAGMVEEAAERVAGVAGWTARAEVADLEALPFADGTFDAVIAMHMLYHLEDPAIGIAELHRVLKPGGHALVTTNGAGNLRALYDFAAEAFGTAPGEPVAVRFGFEQAERLLGARFGNVVAHRFRGQLRITESADVLAALISYPPGDGAPEAQVRALGAAIDRAFAAAGGILVMDKEQAAFVSRRAG